MLQLNIINRDNEREFLFVKKLPIGTQQTKKKKKKDDE